MLLPQKYAYREINFQLIYMQVPSAVILSEAICLYCVVETRRASVERSDLAAVKSEKVSLSVETPSTTPWSPSLEREAKK